MPKDLSLNYLEIPSNNLSASKSFFTAVFDWSFTDFPDPESGEVNYTAFDLDNIDGGFYLSDKKMSTDNGSALIVFYCSDIEVTQEKIIAAGGSIPVPTFAFPGGQRFHFNDPCGNEYAAWSEQ